MRESGQIVDLLHSYADRIGAVEGESSGCGLVQYDAERIDVACGGKLFALRLFG